MSKSAMLALDLFHWYMCSIHQKKKKRSNFIQKFLFLTLLSIRVSLDFQQLSLGFGLSDLDLFRFGFDLLQFGLDLWQFGEVALALALKSTAARDLEPSSKPCIGRPFL